jgi:hypothetical protein
MMWFGEPHAMLWLAFFYFVGSASVICLLLFVLNTWNYGNLIFLLLGVEDAYVLRLQNSRYSDVMNMMGTICYV